MFDTVISTPSKIIIDGFKMKEKEENPILKMLKKILRQFVSRYEKYDQDFDKDDYNIKIIIKK